MITVDADIAISDLGDGDYSVTINTETDTLTVWKGDSGSTYDLKELAPDWASE